MDAIARAGVVLNNYYGQSLCTPARATLMTGKYAHRLGIEYVTSESEITAFSNYSAMPIAEDLLPARLKALAGYRAYGVAKRNPSGMKLRPLPLPLSLSGTASASGTWATARPSTCRGRAASSTSRATRAAASRT
jgi:hypothetical protein